MRDLIVISSTAPGPDENPNDDEIILHSLKYKEFFGVTLGEGHKSKPWKRPILIVSNPNQPNRSVRLRY